MNSLKKDLIFSFLSLPTVEGLEKNKLMVYTATGIFAGIPVLETDENDGDIKAALSYLANNVAENYRKDHNIPDSQLLDGNDGYFLLSDVTLITGQSRINIPIIAIFFDQVIGVSIGNVD